MRHSVRIAGALCLAPLLLIAVGCSSLTESANESAGAAATLTRAGLEMTVAVVPEVVAPSAELTVRLTVTNTARTPSKMSLRCTSLLQSLGIRDIEQGTSLRTVNGDAIELPTLQVGFTVR